MNAVPERHVTLEEYFRLKEAGEGKHEYYRGVIYAIPNKTLRRVLIKGNASCYLHQQLRGKPCTIYLGSLRIKAEATGYYTYSDSLVICGEPRLADGRDDTVTNPSVIIDVLSMSKESKDRWAKFEHYRTIDTLQEYLIIAEDHVHVDHYIRQGAHQWLLVEYMEMEQTIELKSIGCTLSLDAIYETVVFGEE